MPCLAGFALSTLPSQCSESGVLLTDKRLLSAGNDDLDIPPCTITVENSLHHGSPVAPTKILGQMSIPPFDVGRFRTRRPIVILPRANKSKLGYESGSDSSC